MLLLVLRYLTTLETSLTSIPESVYLTLTLLSCNRIECPFTTSLSALLVSFKKICVSFNALSQPGGVPSLDFPSLCQSHLVSRSLLRWQLLFFVRSVFLCSVFLFCLHLPWSSSLPLLLFCSDAHLMDEINRGLTCIVNSPRRHINYVRLCVPRGSHSLMRDRFRKPLDSLTLS